MTSPTAASLTAAGFVTNVNLPDVAGRYLDWINAQTDVLLAIQALESAARSSKHPARVLANAELALQQITATGDNIGGVGGGSVPPDVTALAAKFANLDTATVGQTVSYVESLLVRCGLVM